MAAKGMIEPFADGKKRPGEISSGTSAYGYDMRLADRFRVFRPDAAPPGGVLDPKQEHAEFFESVEGPYVDIPAGSYVLGRSLEYFRLPRDILAICFGKSTYARAGVVVNVTPLEPEWEGYVTISISNTAPVPVRLYAGEGISQVVFLEASEICEVSYADKAGKYQAQQDITHSKAS
jgi:dCTP deaminase